MSSSLSTDSSITSLPLYPFASLSLTLLANSYSISMLFPFAWFMVRDFLGVSSNVSTTDTGMGLGMHLRTEWNVEWMQENMWKGNGGVNGMQDNTQDVNTGKEQISESKYIGFYAGILASAVMLGRCITSMPWGYVSDKWGRKIVLRIGLWSIVVGSIVFGMSTSFEMAVAARFVGGMLNGVIAVTKVCASEIVERQTQQAAALSVVGAVWGVGMIVGPGLSGILSQPAEKFPDAFPPNSIFSIYPYLLPCLICSSIAFVAIIADHFWLPETLQASKTRGLNHHQISTDDESGMSLHATEIAQGPSVLKTPLAFKNNAVLNDQIELVELKNDHSLSLDITSETINSPQRKLFAEEIPISKENVQQYSSLPAGAEVGYTTLTDAVEAAPSDQNKDYLKPSVCSERMLMGSTIFLYSLWSCLDMMSNECFPLWAISKSVDGGLDFDSGRIGLVLSISGVFILGFQLFVFPWLESKYGPLLLFRVASACCAPLFLFFPYIHYFKADTVVLWILLLIISIVKSCLGLIVFTASFMLINNSTTRSNRGSVNGAAMSVASLFKAIGPTVAGFIFSWSIASDRGFPFDFRFVFEIVAILCVVCSVTSLFMTSAINNPPNES